MQFESFNITLFSIIPDYLTWYKVDAQISRGKDVQFDTLNTSETFVLLD